MSTMGCRSFARRVLGIAFAGAAPVVAACSMGPAGPGDLADHTDEALSSCSVSVTTDTYAGAPDYWGTITFKNIGSAAMKSPTIAFKVPSGVTCDYNPSGWKHTQSGTTCTYTRTSALTIKAGGTYTFNYSTDSSKSFTATSVAVSDASCTAGTGSSSSSSSTSTTSSSSSSGASSSSSTSSSSSSSSGGGMTSLGQYVITWYSFQDNTPVNSAQSASGRKLLPYISVAVPFRLLKDFGGTFSYGDKLFLQFLQGRTMPDGTKHTGWVEIDDFCGDNSDDSYCFQTVGGKKYPNTDLYIGDFTKSGMKATSGDCVGPAGNGQELTSVYSGDPGSAWVSGYGGAALGSGKCGDYTSAESQQGGTSGGCWDYTPPTNTVPYCQDCTNASCTSW